MSGAGGSSAVDGHTSARRINARRAEHETTLGPPLNLASGGLSAAR
jgi:hypothetical protein